MVVKAYARGKCKNKKNISVTEITFSIHNYESVRKIEMKRNHEYYEKSWKLISAS